MRRPPSKGIGLRVPTTLLARADEVIDQKQTFALQHVFLFDHLVARGQQTRRHFKSERPGRPAGAQGEALVGGGSVAARIWEDLATGAVAKGLRKYAARALPLPHAQGGAPIEYHPCDLQPLVTGELARVKCPLGRNADVVDAGPPWRRLDALDQLRHPLLKCIG